MDKEAREKQDESMRVFLQNRRKGYQGGKSAPTLTDKRAFQRTSIMAVVKDQKWGLARFADIIYECIKD